MNANKSPAKFKMRILNLEEEHKKFLFDPYYNPQFEYENTIPVEQLKKYGEVDEQQLALATSILDKTLAEYGDEEALLKVEGRILNRGEVTEIITNYLQANNLAKRVKIVFSSSFIARTAVARNPDKTFSLNVRLPLQYREKNIIPVLNHEIGTHVMRWMNEEKQVWHEQRSAYGLHPYLSTEEGLAICNYMFEYPAPYAWMAALYTFSVYNAQYVSFSKLSQILKKYVPSLERRWKICLRTKRGLTDTSQPGGYTKDRIYLSGAVEVLEWLKTHDWDPTPLYIGKISLADLGKFQKIATQDGLMLPDFITKDTYKKRLEEIFSSNLTV